MRIASFLLLLVYCSASFAEQRVWTQAYERLTKPDSIPEATQFGEEESRDYDHLYYAKQAFALAAEVPKPTPNELASFIRAWNKHLDGVLPFHRQYEDSFALSLEMYRLIEDYKDTEAFELALAERYKYRALSKKKAPGSWKAVNYFAKRAFAKFFAKNQRDKEHQYAAEVGRTLFLRVISEPDKILKPEPHDLIRVMNYQENAILQGLLDGRYEYVRQALDSLNETVMLLCDRCPKQVELFEPYSQVIGDFSSLTRGSISEWPMDEIREHAIRFFAMAIARGKSVIEFPKYFSPIAKPNILAMRIIQQVERLDPVVQAEADRVARITLASMAGRIADENEKHSVDEILLGWTPKLTPEVCTNRRRMIIEGSENRN